MAKRIMYECEDCGFLDSQNEDSPFFPNFTTWIKTCYICNKDICSDCAKIHSRNETGLI